MKAKSVISVHMRLFLTRSWPPIRLSILVKTPSSATFVHTQALQRVTYRQTRGPTLERSHISVYCVRMLLQQQGNWKCSWKNTISWKLIEEVANVQVSEITSLLLANYTRSLMLILLNIGCKDGSPVQNVLLANKYLFSLMHHMLTKKFAQDGIMGHQTLRTTAQKWIVE